MVYGWEVSKLAQQTKLIELAELFLSVGNITQARKIAQKLIQGHRDRLRLLARVEVTKENYDAVVSELSEIEYLASEV
jgi:hypothetical protein